MATKKTLNELIAETTDFDSLSMKELEALLGVLSVPAKMIMDAKIQGRVALVNLLKQVTRSSGDQPGSRLEHNENIRRSLHEKMQEQEEAAVDGEDKKEPGKLGAPPPRPKRPTFLKSTFSTKRKPKQAGSQPQVTIHEEEEEQKQAVKGKRVGSLEMSTNDMADVMSKMLHDIESGKPPPTEKETSIESTLAVVQLRKKVAKSKETNHLDVDPAIRNRMTVIEHEYTPTETDMALALRESEFLELEEEEAFDEADDATSGGDVEPQAAPLPPITVSVTDCKRAQFAIQDRFDFEVKCGTAKWDILRYYSDFLDLRDNLHGEGLTHLAENLPNPRADDMDDSDDEEQANSAQNEAEIKQLGEGLKDWLNCICSDLGAQRLLDTVCAEAFFEAFWPVRSAEQKKAQPKNYMTHITKQRTNAEALLKDKANGVFLIRGKTDSSNLVLSVSHGPGKGFWHGIIELLPAGSPQPKYKMRGTKRFHPSLEDLLDFFHSTPYSLQNNGEWKLTTFVDDIQ